MQTKTLFIALAAVLASVSAQTETVPKTPCSDCVMGSLATDPVCSALSPADSQTLFSSVANGVNITALLDATAIPAIHDCACHWTTAAFAPAGPASACAAGGGMCTPDEVTEASTRVQTFQSILGCAPAANATASTSATTATATSTTATPTSNSTATVTSTATGTGSAISTSSPTNGAKPTGSSANFGFTLNLRYIASVAVLGAVAFAL